MGISGHLFLNLLSLSAPFIVLGGRLVRFFIPPPVTSIIVVFPLATLTPLPALIIPMRSLPVILIPGRPLRVLRGRGRRRRVLFPPLLTFTPAPVTSSILFVLAGLVLVVLSVISAAAAASIVRIFIPFRILLRSLLSLLTAAALFVLVLFVFRNVWRWIVRKRRRNLLLETKVQY